MHVTSVRGLIHEVRCRIVTDVGIQRDPNESVGSTRHSAGQLGQTARRGSGIAIRDS